MKLIATLFLLVAVTGGVSNAASIKNADDVRGNVFQSPHNSGDSSSTQEKGHPIVFSLVFQKQRKEIRTCLGTEVRLPSKKIVWVTAAECLDTTKYDSFRLETVHFRTFLNQTYTMNPEIIGYEKHPQYNNVTKENNIAVMERLRYINDDKKASSVLPEKNDLFVNKAVDIFLEWKNKTQNPDPKIPIELISIRTKVIKPIWCKLWYPFSPNKAKHVCASGWYGKGLSKGIIGSPLIDTSTKESKLLGIATQNRRWTRWFGLPIEFLRIEPYAEWLETVDLVRKYN